MRAVFLLLLAVIQHNEALLVKHGKGTPWTNPETKLQVTLLKKSDRFFWTRPGPDSPTPTRADIVQLLYKGSEPLALFKNPRKLKFNGDLKWSNIMNDQRDACWLVDKANASFMVETGCYVGSSTKVWANCMKTRNPKTGVVLAIDTWLGDLSSWIDRIDVNSRSVPDDVLRDGRSMLYDQFMLNMQENNVTNVVPFSTTSSIGARWLGTFNYAPDLAYVDTAHEEGETAMEIEMYYNVLKPGGILAGDDYPGWPGVKHDVDEFIKRHGLRLQFTPSTTTWFVVKPMH